MRATASEVALWSKVTVLAHKVRHVVDELVGKTILPNPVDQSSRKWAKAQGVPHVWGQVLTVRRVGVF